jgi:endonuclease YncB( thermonuclease family)
MDATTDPRPPVPGERPRRATVVNDQLAPVTIPSPMPAMFAQVLAAHDGDTLRVFVWKWGDTYAIWSRARLARINAPELGTLAGAASLAFVHAWLGTADQLVQWPFIVYCQALDNYGRPLIELWRRSDGANLSSELLRAGHATPYPVKGHV